MMFYGSGKGVKHVYKRWIVSSQIAHLIRRSFAILVDFTVAHLSTGCLIFTIKGREVQLVLTTVLMTPQS